MEERNKQVVESLFADLNSKLQAFEEYTEALWKKWSLGPTPIRTNVAEAPALSAGKVSAATEAPREEGIPLTS